MNIQEIPAAYDEFERFNVEHERASPLVRPTIASDRRRSTCT